MEHLIANHNLRRKLTVGAKTKQDVKEGFFLWYLLILYCFLELFR